MRHLATIQQIAEIQPIPGADAIEKVRIRDWWCVAKKSEFAAGDPCVYFEIDSLLPSSNPAFAFLAKGTKERYMLIDGVTYTGYRLKTIRLRGQISQGLALQPAQLGLAGLPVGTDVSDQLGIVKYEPPIPAQLAGQVKGGFPGFIPKTDEERVQNCGDVIARRQGERFYITEKVDGSSATFFKHDGQFGVCSRNLELLDTPENTLWNMARQYRLGEILPDEHAVQGEIVGPGVQGNPLRLPRHELYVFNVYDIKTGRYLDWQALVDFCDRLGLKRVPVVDGDFALDRDVAGLLALADAPSLLNPAVKREGIVIRPLTEQRDIIDGQMARLSFKAISNAYLLAEKE